MNRSKLNLLLAGYTDTSVTVTYLNEMENTIQWYKTLYEDSCAEYEISRQKERKTTERVKDLVAENRRLKTALEREVTRGQYLTESRKWKEMEINDLRYIAQAVPRRGKPYERAKPEKITGSAEQLVEQVAQLNAELSYQENRNHAITRNPDDPKSKTSLIGSFIDHQNNEVTTMPSEEAPINEQEFFISIRINRKDEMESE